MKAQKKKKGMGEDKTLTTRDFEEKSQGESGLLGITCTNIIVKSPRKRNEIIVKVKVDGE